MSEPEDINALTGEEDADLPEEAGEPPHPQDEEDRIEYDVSGEEVVIRDGVA